MHDTLFMEQWVFPFYLKILHGNYATQVIVGDELEKFHSDVHRALDAITPTITARLIRGQWREAITGSWFAGLKKYTEFQHQIGERLLASSACYAGQSHALAMASFADDTSVEYLTRYLDTYLRRPDCIYDQNWVMASLLWIDHDNSTNHSEPFLAPGGLWDQFTADKVTPDDNQAWTIDSNRKRFWRTMEYCRKHFMAL
ncbi:DUF6000 family protein [Lignipirellula cremea]|uniref:Uncharacterized protein n=1 Tax=Lignipirellula cremea TaxID=2528010 RepID=A0A518DTJ3_9BACT|nr:DUF6000 family protein [Lignipirellula cremea]QDU95161.1 hypothetical protein Pla8534_29730 [Lignipirellula cremea]